MGTTSLLRREKTLQENGSLVDVPIIAGNTLRGRLRRAGEDLLRGELGYDHELPLAAAHDTTCGRVERWRRCPGRH